ncbi:MAG: GNAT family N-acetyltransferase [Ruminiclostridium sp.]|nr:GNAT family N-acetyltransferase [Ruminiclostridium sp.]
MVNNISKKYIQLELLTEENIDKVRAICRDDISEEWVDSVDTLMDYTNYGIEHGCIGHAYAIRYEDDYIGVILLGEAIPWETDPIEMQNAPFYRLMGFVLDNHYRGYGLGGAVLEMVITQVYEEFGVRPIACGVHRDNLRAAKFYERHGFLKNNAIEGNDIYYLRLIDKNKIEKCERQQATNKMVRAITDILSGCGATIYLYGSSVLDDFKLGWSDIDILVLTEKQITEEQAQKLVMLRQTLLEGEPENLYYRSFEGGMLTLKTFLSGENDRVVYWGTSGQRITDTYKFDSFGMMELLDNGVLLHGEDIRCQLKAPSYDDLYADVKRHYETIRKYVKTAGRDFYSFGWMLDISRCLYTLRTGKIIAKTAAAEWALENKLCPVPDVLGLALEVRKSPIIHTDDATLNYAETLAEPIQRFADVLENELRYPI